VSDWRSDWHTLAPAAALEAAATTPAGLTEAEATARAARFGPNRMPAPEAVSALKILRDQLTGVVVLLLISAAAVAIAMGDYIEAAAIAGVLVINTSIGFATEWRARRAMEALRDLEVARASVLRDGRLQLVFAERLVPGDLVEVNAGHVVPADGRLIQTTDLRIAEAALTGESVPVSKHADLVVEADTDLADRANMVFKGTTVSAGFGRAVVTATGANTEVGRIGTLTSRVTPEPTPLERQLDALGRRLVWLTLAIAAVVALLGAANGAPWSLVVETAIALAVAAVPEALPAVATIALAVGMNRMARRHALVRRLPAVESLGSTTIVCTDKTRTLTSGDMVVVRVWAAGASFDPRSSIEDATPAAARVLRAAALASRPQVIDDVAGPLRDPVDAAVLEAAARLPPSAEWSESTPAAVIPFSSDRKWMAAFYDADPHLVACVKGAPRAILDRSASAITQEGEQVLDDAARRNLEGVNDALARDGLRVLAVASGRVHHSTDAALHGLVLLGFVGLADPPAPGVSATIAQLRAAGLRTVMLTGDQRLTAEAVGRAVGLLGDGEAGVDGRALDTLAGDERDALIARTAAFSRVTPEHKLVIVRSLQARGEIVAMLGDGINDAAALKKADVGVAMGVRGTDVAKQAAAIILQDDRFETISAAVEEGRIIFDNIRKFVFYLFSCNVAEVLVLLSAGLAGLPSPLTPLQLLWLNMVTDTFPALALALEPGDGDVMRRPPRDPRSGILSRSFVINVLTFAALITGSTMAAYVWALATEPARASTFAFMTLALAQIAHLGNARSRGPVLALRRAVANPYALTGVAIALTLQVAAVAVAPLASLLDIVSLSARDWVVVVGLAAVPAVGGQLFKLVRRRQEIASGDPG
jgi:Ca2+-transporting ATPase